MKSKGNLKAANDNKVSFTCACNTCMHRVGVSGHGVNTVVECEVGPSIYATTKKNGCPNQHTACAPS